VYKYPTTWSKEGGARVDLPVRRTLEDREGLKGSLSPAGEPPCDGLSAQSWRHRNCYGTFSCGWAMGEM